MSILNNKKKIALYKQLFFFPEWFYSLKCVLHKPRLERLIRIFMDIYTYEIFSICHSFLCSFLNMVNISLSFWNVLIFVSTGTQILLYLFLSIQNNLRPDWNSISTLSFFRELLCGLKTNICEIKLFDSSTILLRRAILCGIEYEISVYEGQTHF